MSVPRKTTLKLGRVSFTVRPKSDIILIGVGTKLASVSKKKMWELLFGIMGPEQMAEMMPARTEFINRYRKKLSVRLAKDMKAGECVNIICEVDVEKTIADAIEAAMKDEIASKKKGPELSTDR